MVTETGNLQGNTLMVHLHMYPDSTAQLTLIIIENKKAHRRFELTYFLSFQTISEGQGIMADDENEKEYRWETGYEKTW